MYGHAVHAEQKDKLAANAVHNISSSQERLVPETYVRVILFILEGTWSACARSLWLMQQALPLQPMIRKMQSYSADGQPTSNEMQQTHTSSNERSKCEPPLESALNAPAKTWQFLSKFPACFLPSTHVYAWRCSTNMSPKKLQAGDYHVAWISPLSDVEVLPSRLMLDEEHTTPDYDAAYDDNVYTCGALAGHNVVIATCPPGLTGNVNAGRVTAPMFKTFSAIRMTVLVGIGGGIPRAVPSDDPVDDIHLGDVVVGWPGDGGPACVYYDSGRWHSDGEFETLGTIDRPDRILLNALAKLQGDHDVDRSTFQDHRDRLLASKHRRKYTFPGSDRDLLFEAAYRHNGLPKDGCKTCDGTKLIHRAKRTAEEAAGLTFHRGRIATGNAVIRDAERRDQIRDLCDGAICIEMEAAGVDAARSCLVIRGISDYSDSHKSDIWQPYAAGNAAVFARELLTKIKPMNIRREQKGHFVVPFGRNRDFVGREAILKQLLEVIPPKAQSDDCQRSVVEGLGGIGKTQVAIEAAYRLRETYPDCSVFWVPAVNLVTFENAYRGIGQALKVPGRDDDNADVLCLIQAYLSREEIGDWLLIIDNADDLQLLFNEVKLASFLPFSRNGSILFTTRNYQAAVRLCNPGKLIKLAELDYSESLQLLRQGLQASQIGETQVLNQLLNHLSYLTLAVKQASAYIASNPFITITKYLEYCKTSDAEMIKLLSFELENQGHYGNAQKAIATTWLISFEQITRDAPVAAAYLKTICYFGDKDIPANLLPSGSSNREADEAISTLLSYAFIAQREAGDRFDVHRLVQLVMRNWLLQNGEAKDQIMKTTLHVAGKFPEPELAHRDTWVIYLPHIQIVMDFLTECTYEPEIFELLERVARGYEGLSKYKEAEKVLRKLQAFEEALYKGEYLEISRSLRLLPKLLWRQGRHKEAETILRHALSSIEGFPTHQQSDMAHFKIELANMLSRREKFEEAEQMFRQMIHSMEQVLGVNHPDTFTLKSDLASTLYDQERFKEAEDAYRELIALREVTLGRKHPDVLYSMGALADTLARQHKDDQAEVIIRHSLELSKDIINDGLVRILAMESLAQNLGNQGKYQEAEDLLRQTLALKCKTLGSENYQTLGTVNLLASSLGRAGKLDEAEELYRQTLALRKEALGARHPYTLDSELGFSYILIEQKKYEEGEALLRQSLAVSKEVLGHDHSHTLYIRANLGRLLSRLGKVEEREAMTHQVQAVKGEKLRRWEAMISSIDIQSATSRRDEKERRRRRFMSTFGGRRAMRQRVSNPHSVYFRGIKRHRRLCLALVESRCGGNRSYVNEVSAVSATLSLER